MGRQKNRSLEVIRVPLQTAEDLLKLPDPIRRRIQRELELEELEEFLRQRGKS